MKIVLASYLHGYGGAERQILMLADALLEYGHDIYVVAIADKNFCYKISPRIKVVDITWAERKRGIKLLNRFVAFKDAMKKIQPDISIHYWMQSAYFSTMLPHRWSGKIVYAERGDPYDSEFDGMLGLVRTITFKFMDGFVFQSEGARDFFNDKIKNKSIVIHNSVSVPPGKYEIPEFRTKRIVTVGRLHPQKNQKLLIDAFMKVTSQYPDYVLEIYGDGVLEEELKTQISSYGAEDKVLLKGVSKNVFDVIRTAALFVLTSDFEGMPNALMEAMALGLPCISTDCRPGGARTLIESGVNGIITPVGDSDSLAKEMAFLLEHKDVAEEYGRRALKILDTHTPSSVFAQWNQYITSLV